jgi:hypothetical protein
MTRFVPEDRVANCPTGGGGEQQNRRSVAVVPKCGKRRDHDLDLGHARLQVA